MHPTQNVYSFISGKNWKLSLAEIASYFSANSCKFEVTEFSRGYFIIKTEDALMGSIIDDLGGTLKIGDTAAVIPTEVVAKAFLVGDKQIKKQFKTFLPLDLLAEKIPSASHGKSVFGVSIYWTDPKFRYAAIKVNHFLGSALKEEMRKGGKKSRFMGFPRDRTKPQLTAVEVLKQGLLENKSEILFCIGNRETIVGRTIAVHNPFEFQKRDVEKPVQRKIFGISPRTS